MKPPFRLLLVLSLWWNRCSSTLFGENEQSDPWLQDCQQKHPDLEVITRDVVIVGGGSSGTWAAIKLRDMNYTVSLIEQKNRLGGHTETYIDPKTGTPLDYSVVIFHDIDVVRRYFNRFGIPLTRAGSLSQRTLYLDFSTGKVVNYTAQNFTDALDAYDEQLKKYPYLQDGFDLPYPVPEDLLLPFGKFARKYNLDNWVPVAFTYAQGVGNFLELPTIYVMKLLGLTVVQSIRTSFLKTARSNNSEIYSLAQRELGQDALLNSTVLGTSRRPLPHTPNAAIRLLVRTPAGPRLILAKQLLLAIPPTPANLGPFALDPDALSLFARFRYSYYFTGLLNNTGLADPAQLQNVDPANPFALPDLPGAYDFSPTRVPGIVDVKYGAPVGAAHASSVADFEGAVLATLGRLREGGDVRFAALPAGGAPEFVAASLHAPFEMIVGPEDIRAGFYREVGALQGRQGVWWTGAAWHAQDSSLLWQFTEKIVERLVARL